MPRMDRNLQLEVGLDLLPQHYRRIRAVEVVYRPVDGGSFRHKTLTNYGLRVDGKLDLSRFSGKVVEYFFSFELDNGTREYYPRGAPHHDLLQVSVGGRQLLPAREKKVVLISPEAGEIVYTDEVVITASFFAIQEVIDPQSIHSAAERLGCIAVCPFA